MNLDELPEALKYTPNLFRISLWMISPSSLYWVRKVSVICLSVRPCLSIISSPRGRQETSHWFENKPKNRTRGETWGALCCDVFSLEGGCQNQEPTSLVCARFVHPGTCPVLISFGGRVTLGCTCLAQTRGGDSSLLELPSASGPGDWDRGGPPTGARLPAPVTAAFPRTTRQAQPVLSVNAWS